MAVELTFSTESNKDKGSVILEYSGNVAAGATGPWIKLPDLAGKVQVWLVSLIPSGGTARVEVTNSIRSEVDGGTAQAYVWDDGAVSVATKDAFENVSAVRAVGVTGSAKIEVRVS